MPGIESISNLASFFLLLVRLYSGGNNEAKGGDMRTGNGLCWVSQESAGGQLTPGSPIAGVWSPVWLTDSWSVDSSVAY
jgi:hypothetical protein